MIMTPSFPLPLGMTLSESPFLPNVSRPNGFRPNDITPPRHYGLTETTCLNKYQSYLNMPKVQDEMLKTCTSIKLAIYLKKCISL